MELNAIISLVSANVLRDGRELVAIFLARMDITAKVVIKCANVKMVLNAVRMMATVYAKMDGWVHIVMTFARKGMYTFTVLRIQFDPKLN